MTFNGLIKSRRLGLCNGLEEIINPDIDHNRDLYWTKPRILDNSCSMKSPPHYLLLLALLTGLHVTIGLQSNVTKVQDLLNGSSVATDPEPPHFGVHFSPKAKGAALNRFQAWIALVSCAGGCAFNDWNQAALLVLCEKSYFVGFRITSNPVSKPPYLQTRSVLWTLREILTYWELLLTIESDQREMTYLVYEDDRDEATRMAIGTAFVTPGPKQEPRLSINGHESPTEGGVFPITNLTIDTALLPDYPAIPPFNRQPIDLNINVQSGGGTVCSDIQFYQASLEAIIRLAELDAKGPIGNGLSLYIEGERPSGLTFTYQIGPVDKAGAEAGLLKVNLAVLAITELSRIMQDVAENIRYHALRADIKVADSDFRLGQIKIFAGGSPSGPDSLVGTA